MDIGNDPIWCYGCGVEITGMPVVDGGHYYCCQDCVAGVKCKCGERMEMEEEYQSLDSMGE